MMKKRVFIVAALVLVMCANCSYAAKNIILMIGDGMGFQQINAGSYYISGQALKLCFEPYYKCCVRTSNIKGETTDSAAAATAIATGHKVENGVESLDPNGKPYKTILEIAKESGKRAGLVTTVPITHATPAGFASHIVDRTKVIDIGNYYLSNSQPDLLFGGGDPKKRSTYFTSAQIKIAQEIGYKIVYNCLEMESLRPFKDDKAIGLFSGDDMTYEYDRLENCAEPHLSQMAIKALSLLDTDPDGFFVLIEGGLIDHGAHAGNINQTTREVVEFNNTVSQVMKWMRSRTDTLLIVTADHETNGLFATNKGMGVIPDAFWTGGGYHTGVNVPFFCLGADSDLVNTYIKGGLIENTDIFKIMCSAMAANK